MNVIALRRVRNLTPPKQQRERCFTCHDEGQVVAATRVETFNGRSAEVEEMGPCPYCELGYKIEYQPGSPWGDAGFWQGREQPPRATFVSAPPMTPAGQVAAIKALSETIGRPFPSEDDDLRPRSRPIEELRALMSDEAWFAQEAERKQREREDGDGYA